MTLIEDAKLRFPNARVPLLKVTKIVVHHPVANWTVQRTHDYHLGIQYNGIGYNYYVQKDGRAFYGRSGPDKEYQGAHAIGRNNDTIGVCAEGNFEVEKMQPLQYNKLVDVLVFLCKKHKLTYKDVVGHKELPGQSTACPGKNLNLDQLREDVRKKLEGKSKGDAKMEQELKDLQKRVAAMEKHFERQENMNPSNWALEYWEDVVKNGYFDGTRPQAFITREQVAAVTNRLRKNLLARIDALESKLNQLDK